MKCEAKIQSKCKFAILKEHNKANRQGSRNVNYQNCFQMSHVCCVNKKEKKNLEV